MIPRCIEVYHGWTNTNNIKLEAELVLSLHHSIFMRDIYSYSVINNWEVTLIIKGLGFFGANFAQRIDFFGDNTMTIYIYIY